MEIQKWLQKYQEKVIQTFGKERICFLGLQGSQARKEATPESDLDVVLILDRLSFSDLARYQKLLDTLPNREKICGFTAGKEELLAWNILELFQFYHDTIPLLGNLETMMPTFSEEILRKSLIAGACSLYHSCTHLFLQKGSPEQLLPLYKSGFYLLQIKCVLEGHPYPPSKVALWKVLTDPLDKTILQPLLNPKERFLNSQSLEQRCAPLFHWSAGILHTFG